VENSESNIRELKLALRKTFVWVVELPTFSLVFNGASCNEHKTFLSRVSPSHACYIYINASFRKHAKVSTHLHQSSLRENIQKKGRETERNRGWPLEQLIWCFGVSFKEAYQCTTWRSSGGHITATVAALCISWKMFPPLMPVLLIRGMFHSPRNILGQIVVPCPYLLPNPLLNVLFSVTCQAEIERMTNFSRGLTWLG
jgi:hypothetical protein